MNGERIHGLFQLLVIWGLFTNFPGTSKVDLQIFSEFWCLDGMFGGVPTLSFGGNGCVGFGFQPKNTICFHGKTTDME